jgi:hypothetical protein
MPEPVHDEAMIILCGLRPFVEGLLDQASRRDPEGPFRFSVLSAVGLGIEQPGRISARESLNLDG